MVRGNAIHDERILAVLGRHLDAKLHVRSFVLVGEHLTDVVQQRSPLREDDVESELARHNAGKPRHLLRVLQNVLAIARSPMHSSDKLDQLWMQSVDSRLVRRLLADLDNLSIHFLAGLIDDLLDPTGVDAPIRHQLFQGEAGYLAADRIEAGNDDGVGRVVDDDVDASCKLEGPNVPPFSADDPPFHFIVRQ